MINNITIATADDITTFSDDVNIYPVDLSGTINTLSNALNWLEKKAIISDQSFFFFNLLSVILGTHPWPLSVFSVAQSENNEPYIFNDSFTLNAQHLRGFMKKSIRLPIALRLRENIHSLLNRQVIMYFAIM